MSNTVNSNEPTSAFIGAAWVALGVGILGYLVGLWNTATMELNEKGYYFAVFVLALYAAISLQKAVRDKAEDIPVTNIYFGITWGVLGLAILLLGFGLFKADLIVSVKGYFAMSFVLSIFALITVQKNIRDMTDSYGNTDPSVFPKAVQSSVEDGLDVAALLED